MKSIRSGAYLPALGVIGLIIIWYVAVWYEVVEPGAVALADGYLPRALEGDDRRPARLRLLADG